MKIFNLWSMQCWGETVLHPQNILTCKKNEKLPLDYSYLHIFTTAHTLAIVIIESAHSLALWTGMNLEFVPKNLKN